MIIYLENNNYKYETEKLVRMYLPFEKIVFSEEGEKAETKTGEDESTAFLKISENSPYMATATLNLFKKTATKTLGIGVQNDYREAERVLATALLSCFADITGYFPPWGILTGVRPGKLYSRICKSDGEAQAERCFEEKLSVAESKRSLCRETYKSEQKIVDLSTPKSFSLYIAIPFCPSRCSYCSFVSHSVEHAKKLIPEYVERLCEELSATAKTVKQLGLRLETVYMGGGTPTTLSAEQLDRVLGVVRREFDLSHLREFTVEAGRPDTITREKLEALKNNGVSRISINPQTMNDSVLNAIGRKHTAKETVDAFLLAREVGFDNINTDLIAGLPTDTLESFSNTVEQIIGLSPESVTVHSLSVKRSAALNKVGEEVRDLEGIEAGKMVDFARNRLKEAGILPYYMYRQSKTVGNLENVGYSKKGYECLYNVYIMDETHTVIGCGAGAVTLMKAPFGDNIERIYNFKYPYEYINRFDELSDRKKGLIAFYETNGGMD